MLFSLYTLVKIWCTKYDNKLQQAGQLVTKIGGDTISDLKERASILWVCFVIQEFHGQIHLGDATSLVYSIHRNSVNIEGSEKSCSK